MEAPSEAYPLTWPVGWPRTTNRRHAKFGKRVAVRSGESSWTRAETLTIGDGLKRLQGELGRLGATHVVISSNLRRNLDGSITANQGKHGMDTGIAVYFKLKGKSRVLACDRWFSAADNMAAIAGHIDAIRACDRYGVGTLDQAFAGYQALPAQAASWFVVLEFAVPPTNWDTVEARYKSLARTHHPDAGGSGETMAKINEAYATARKEFGK